MSSILKDDFSPKRPITQVPSAWFNRVAKILNGMVAGMGITINKDSPDSSGFEIAIDPEQVTEDLGLMNTISDQTVAGNKTFSDDATFSGSVTASGRMNLGSDIFGTEGRTQSLHICAGQTWEHGAHAVFSKSGGFSVVSEAMGRDGVMTAAYYLSGSNDGRLTWGGTTTDSTSTTDNQLPKLGYINDKFIRKSAAGAANGVATLDSNAKVQMSQINTGTTSSTVALGNHTHTHDKISDWDTATEDFMTEADFEDDFVAKTELEKDNDDCFTEPLAQHGHWASNVFVVKSGGTMTTLGDYFTNDNKIDAQMLKLKESGGLSADSNGLSLGGMAASKWMKTDESGKASTTNETPLLIDPSQSGVVYNNAGAITYKTDLYDANGDKKFVDTSTAQTVAGVKTFSDDATFSSSIHGQIYVKSKTAYVGDGTADGPLISLRDKNNANYGIIQGRNNSVIMSARKANGAEWNQFSVYYDNGKRRVTRSPLAEDYTATDSDEVATCGWTNDKFCRKDDVVKISGSQTVTGTKTFTNHIYLMGTIADTNIQVFRDSGAARSYIYPGAVYLIGNSDASAYVAFRGNASSTDTGIIIDNGSNLTIRHNSEVKLYNSGASTVSLTATPTDTTETTSLNVATLGWTNDKFIRKSADSAPNEDKVLMRLEGQTEATWQTSQTTPTSPTSSATLSADAADQNLQTDSWTYDGTNGVIVWMTTRTRWNGTNLIEYRRPFTFSKNGMLYAVGQETSRNVETPMEIKWS